MQPAKVYFSKRYPNEISFFRDNFCQTQIRAYLSLGVKLKHLIMISKKNEDNDSSNGHKEALPWRESLDRLEISSYISTDVFCGFLHLFNSWGWHENTNYLFRVIFVNKFSWSFREKSLKFLVFADFLKTVLSKNKPHNVPYLQYMYMPVQQYRQDKPTFP